MELKLFRNKGFRNREKGVNLHKADLHDFNPFICPIPN
jgi:hypothetical protein